jgi:hypothetical protein
LLGTGVMGFRIREAAILGNRRSVWLQTAIALPLLAATLIGLWLLLMYPRLASMMPPNPFGPDWDCSNYGKGSLVCFKQAPPP